MFILLRSKILFLPIILLLVFLLAFYVWQVNAMISSTYLRDSLLHRIKELNARAVELSITRSQTEFLANAVESAADFSSFEQVGKITYIRVLNGVVVRADKDEVLAP